MLWFWLVDFKHSTGAPNILNCNFKGKSFTSFLTVTFALAAGRCFAESPWSSWGQCKQQGPQRNGLHHHKQACLFSPIDISHHAHTACISIHNLSGGGHWGEEESEREKEDNTVQEYSGALSLAGSFNSLSVLQLSFGWSFFFSYEYKT